MFIVYCGYMSHNLKSRRLKNARQSNLCICALRSCLHGARSMRIRTLPFSRHLHVRVDVGNSLQGCLGSRVCVCLGYSNAKGCVTGIKRTTRQYTYYARPASQCISGIVPHAAGEASRAAPAIAAFRRFSVSCPLDPLHSRWRQYPQSRLQLFF